MAAFDKTSEKQTILESEKDYTTLEKIDLTDIAQAIDGSRSKPKDDTYYKKNLGSELKPKKFWFW